MSANSVPHSLLSSRTLAIAAGTLSLSSGVYLLYRYWNRSGRERERKAVSIVQKAMDGPYAFLNWLTDKGPYDDIAQLENESAVADLYSRTDYGASVGLSKTTDSASDSNANGLIFFMAAKLFDQPNTEIRVTGGGGLLDFSAISSVLLGHTAAVLYLKEKSQGKDKELSGLVSMDIKSVKPANKGGSSGGLGAALAFVSLALKRPLKQFVAVTGRISQCGAVEPITGIPQKVVAASLGNMNVIVLPKKNEKNVNDLTFVPESLQIIYVNDLSEAVDICIE